MAKIEKMSMAELEKTMVNYNEKFKILDLKRKEVMRKIKEKEKEEEIREAIFFKDLFFSIIDYKNLNNDDMNEIKIKIDNLKKYSEKEKEKYKESLEKIIKKEQKKQQQK